MSRETDFEAPTTYDTYDEQSLGRMKFEKAPDGSWVRKAERQAWEHDQIHPGVEEEAKIREMEDGWTLRGTLSREGPRLTFRLHISQRTFMLRLPSPSL